MSERLESALKIVCLMLAGLVLFHAARLAASQGPLKEVHVPIPPAPPVAAVNVASSKIPGAPVRGMPPGRTKSSLPDAIQKSVDKIVQSEILGPVVRPPPMALLGIAGLDALMRGPNGQTSLLRLGGEMGGIKLLQIGTNRVLIEHEGEKKELTIFSGFGGETLLSKEKENEK
ncbi:MAG: hypothetical protein O2960_00900 [Verrucomicrobia bacterium]|nr:hypothetical protein [Verrucomicrobiota bacterium]